MTDHPEVLEGSAQEIGNDSTGQELALASQTPATLFRTDDPVQVISRATDVANALKPVLVERKMVIRIQQKEHVTIEGWQTLGAMLGVTPIVEWTRPLDDGWEARAVARTLDGRTIGGGEGECRRAEARWKKADDYAIRSMAQTRAQSKALASVLRFVVTLAGYSGTPAEEMPSERQQEAPKADPKPTGDPLPEDRVNALGRGIGRVGVHFDRLCLLFGSIGADAPSINRSDSLRKALRALSPEQADQLEAALRAEADKESA